MKEYWKEIKNFENYQVSNLGNVRSLDKLIVCGSRNHKIYERKHKGKILAQAKNKKGYCIVGLRKNGKTITKQVHLLQMTTFVPNPNNYRCINHKDENPSNNFIYINDDGSVDLEKSNLEWCTHQYNITYGTAIKRRVEKLLNNEIRSKPIIQYDLDGNFIKEWPSLNEIKRNTTYSIGNICKCCSNNYPFCKTYKGYVWKYK